MQLDSDSNELVTLLTVQDHFSISEAGLTLAPDFAMPQSNGWREFSFTVVVRNAGEKERRFRARATPVHFHTHDPSAVRRGWRLLITLPMATKADVPIGSTVLCNANTIQRLFDGE
jgi:hypothetical protein